VCVAGAMDRALQCGNRVCARRAESRRLEMHRTRLKNVRPLVDTSEPKAAHFDHVRMNLKKEQMLEERYTEIDRENRILLKKMSNIAKQTPPNSARLSGPNSLNQNARKRELLRITSDNQAILKRIQQAQPVYNHVEMQGEHRKQQTYLRNCTEFPLVLRTARGRPSELVPLSPTTPPENQGASSGALEQASSGALEQEGEIMFQEGEIMQVFQEGRKINETFYIIEMATDGRCLYIDATGPEARNGEQETLQLTIKEKIHRQIHRELNGDYSLIANHLVVHKGELQIEMPEVVHKGELQFEMPEAPTTATYTRSPKASSRGPSKGTNTPQVAGRASRGGTPRVRAASVSPKADELGFEEFTKRTASGDRR